MWCTGKQQNEQKQKRARAFQDQPAPVLAARATHRRRADLSRCGRQHHARSTPSRCARRSAGRSSRSLFREGQDVKRGDVLAEIDPRTYQAQYDQAVAKKAQDEATLANARARSRSLHAARGVELRIEAAGRHAEGAGRAARSAGAGRSGGDRQRPHDAELHQDRRADRRPHRPAPGRRRQSGAGERHHRHRGDHADPADLGAVQPAAAAVPAGEQGLRARPAATSTRSAADGKTIVDRGTLAGDRQPDGSDHRHDPHEGGVSQRATCSSGRGSSSMSACWSRR